MQDNYRAPKKGFLLFYKMQDIHTISMLTHVLAQNSMNPFLYWCITFNVNHEYL